MIAKKFRLKERELKKVLHKWKPFFSHNVVLNSFTNTCGYHRFWIVLSWKSVKNAIHRNFFRRLFYEQLWAYMRQESDCHYDAVFVVKKQIKLDGKDEKNVAIFKKDIHFLLRKVFNIQIQKTWKK